MRERTIGKRLRTGFGALAVAAVLVGTTQQAGATGDHEAVATDYQPDLQISRNGTTFIGDGTYNGGRGQAVSRSAARGGTATFHFRVQADTMPDPDTVAEDYDWNLRLTGCGTGNSGFRVRYYVSSPPRADVTSFFAGDGLAIDGGSGIGALGLTSPQGIPFHVEVKVKQSAPVGATLSCKIRAATVEGSDTVKLTVSRR